MIGKKPEIEKEAEKPTLPGADAIHQNLSDLLPREDPLFGDPERPKGNIEKILAEPGKPMKPRSGGDRFRF